MINSKDGRKPENVESLRHLLELTHTAVDLPKGILPLDDDTFVWPGDLLIDNNRKNPFCLIGSDEKYDSLIGGTALSARLSPLCYEIYSVDMSKLPATETD